MPTVGGLFDGCGLLAYGLHLAGLEHRWLCEVDPFRRELLGRRFPGVRVFDDVRAVGSASAERVDVIAGGFPCKGASTAGKREGFGHPETVLWREMARAVRELRPRYVVVENVANILAVHDGAVWGEVLGDLAACGFDVVWDCFPAGAFGAPHLRDRVIAIATHPSRGGQGTSERHLRPGEFHAEGCGEVATADALGPGGPAGRGRQREGSGEPGARRRDHALAGPPAPPDASRDGVRQQPEPERGRGRAGVSPATGATAPDADRRRQPEQPERHGGASSGSARPSRDDALGRSVRVEWGDYLPAIRRWEQIAGPAPCPLVRRVDDRRAARVERSRLSALGDGVQVQLGEMVGRFLMEAMA